MSRSLPVECPQWVIRCVAIQSPGKGLSAAGPIADKRGYSSFVRLVPIANNAPQQTASPFDQLVSAGDDLRWRTSVQRLRSINWKRPPT